VAKRGFFDKEAGDLIPYERVLWKSPDGKWWHGLGQDYDGTRGGKAFTRCLIGPPPST
jgi:hypothetical protein